MHEWRCLYMKFKVTSACIPVQMLALIYRLCWQHKCLIYMCAWCAPAFCWCITGVPLLQDHRPTLKEDTTAAGPEHAKQLHNPCWEKLGHPISTVC